MRPTRIVWLFLLPGLLAAFPRPQLPFAPLSYSCPLVAEPPLVDGRLDDPAWNEATWSADFQDIEGDLRPAPFHRTRMKLVWDKHALYIGAELEEAHLWATYDQRDMVIYHENDFEVFIDPDGDNHDYFELEINALGTEWDLYLTRPYRDSGDALDHWDMRGLTSAIGLSGTLNDPGDRDEGWIVELAIPWNALRQGGHRTMPPEPGDRWRINFSRVQYHLDHDGGVYTRRRDESGNALPEFNWVWSPQGLIAMHYPERWGVVEFSTRARAFDPLQDSALLAGEVLMQLYYSQRELQEHSGSFATSTAGLNDVPSMPDGWSTPVIHGWKSGFVACSTGPGFELRVDEQGRLTRHTAEKSP